MFPGLPFVLLRTTLRNDTETLVDTNQVRYPAITLPPGTVAPTWRVLGAGGLSGVPDNPGSHAYLAVANPETRAGVVCGWLTHDPYELRIILPDESPRWDVTAVTTVESDSTTVDPAEVQHDGRQLRVSLRSPTSRELNVFE